MSASQAHEIRQNTRSAIVWHAPLWDVATRQAPGRSATVLPGEPPKTSLRRRIAAAFGLAAR